MSGENELYDFDNIVPEEILNEEILNEVFKINEIGNIDDLLFSSANPNEIQPNRFFASFPQKNENKITEELTSDLSNDSDANSSMCALSPNQYEQEELEKLIVDWSNKIMIKEEPTARRSNRNVVQRQPILNRIRGENEVIKTNKRNDSSSKNKKMKNCKHVWQFLRDELQSESANVEWIDQNKGVFKIVNQTEIAKQWGDFKERKSSKPMDYEKMSRGIRHSRKDGFFQFIDKEQSYGVKLVYQFGPKAISNCKWLKGFVILD